MPWPKCEISRYQLQPCQLVCFLGTLIAFSRRLCAYRINIWISLWFDWLCDMINSPNMLFQPWNLTQFILLVADWIFLRFKWVKWEQLSTKIQFINLTLYKLIIWVRLYCPTNRINCSVWSGMALSKPTGLGYWMAQYHQLQ